MTTGDPIQMSKNHKNQSSTGKNKTRTGAQQKATAMPSYSESNTQASITKVRDDHWRYRKSEFLGVLPGSAGFSLTSFPINPGLSQTFPWLSEIAKNFEFYRFLSFRVRSIPKSNDFAKGSVIIAPEYDSNESDPKTLVDLLAYDEAKETSVRQNSGCTFSVRRMHANNGDKFVRTGPIRPDLLPSRDCGRILIGLDGQTGNDDVGAAVVSIWIDYTLELFSPQKPQALINLPLSTQSYRKMDEGFETISMPAGDALVPWPTAIPSVSPGETLGIQQVVVGGKHHFRVPRGAYTVSFSIGINSDPQPRFAIWRFRWDEVDAETSAQVKAIGIAHMQPGSTVDTTLEFNVQTVTMADLYLDVTNPTTDYAISYDGTYVGPGPGIWDNVEVNVTFRSA